MKEEPPPDTEYAGFYPREPLVRPVPFWVKLTLAGVRRRSWAKFFFWAMIALLLVCLGPLSFGWSFLTFRYRVLLVLAIPYCVFGAWMYHASAKWVDQNGRWKR